MRTKNKIRSRRTAQTKKELKNKEKQRKSPVPPLSAKQKRDFKIGAPPSPLAARAASSADNNQDGFSRYSGSSRDKQNKQTKPNARGVAGTPVPRGRLV